MKMKRNRVSVSKHLNRVMLDCNWIVAGGKRDE